MLQEDNRQNPRPLEIRPDYIWEVQGLRTFAALLVAVYHIWLNRVSGGVDAFFVIAAFFMATSFLRDDRVTAGRVVRYWASTVRRVFPGASIVILATMLGVRTLMPSMTWFDAIRDATASTLFVENWWLAFTGTDYLTQDADKSPFQQMWALSLQIQYYALLPVILWTASLIARRFLLSRAATWNAILGGLLVISLAYSIFMTERNQPWTYFDSLARCWEYMFGALLAINFAQLPVFRPKVMKIAGYVALGILVSFAAIVPVSSLFPGYAAIIPVLATLVIIWVGRSGVSIEPLRWKPVLRFADSSFTFYLWHWPLLVFYRAYTEAADVGLLPGLGIMITAAVLAVATLRLLETPFRRWAMLEARPGLSLALSCFVLLPALAEIIFFRHNFQIRSASAEAAVDDFSPSVPGMAKTTHLIPDPIIARNDLTKARQQGCHQDIQKSAVIECRYGKENAKRTVALVGSSHSEQLFPAIEQIAKDQNLQLITFLKSACVMSDPPTDFVLAHPASCLEWNRRVEARLIELRPNLVVTIATRGSGAKEQVPESFKSQWRRLANAGIGVLALRDNPWYRFNPVGCVEVHGPESTSCMQSRDTAYNRRDPGKDIQIEGVIYADTSALFCDNQVCMPARDGILRYRDRHHLSATFVKTLTPDLSRIFKRAWIDEAWVDQGPGRRRRYIGKEYHRRPVPAGRETVRQECASIHSLSCA